MNTYIIYKASNTINDKVYIGCTKHFERRVKDHLRCSPTEDCEFHRAIEELGKDKFKFEIIDKAEGIEEGHRLEQFYIDKYDSFKNGYNSTIGGYTATPWNVKPIVCLDLEGNFVKRYDSAGEAKRDGYSDSNVLECCKGILRSVKSHTFMFEDDYEANGPKRYIKPTPFNLTPVVQCGLDGTFIKRFESIRQAAEETGVARPMVSASVTGKSKTASGYIFVYEKDYPIKDISARQQMKKGKKVAQIDLDTGKVIKVYNRIADAGRELGVNYKAIHKVVDKEDRTAYGFRWESR